MRDFPGCVATVGDIATEPGSFNVVPGRARLRLECRSLDPRELDALEQALSARALADAEAFGLAVSIERVGRWDPAPTDERVQQALGEAATALGLSTLRLPSGAGHDAQLLAAITPSGMVFVPSVGGISHDPAEQTSFEDCVNGANVLLGATLRLAGAAVPDLTGKRARAGRARGAPHRRGRVRANPSRSARDRRAPRSEIRRDRVVQAGRRDRGARGCDRSPSHRRAPAGSSRSRASNSEPEAWYSPSSTWVSGSPSAVRTAASVARVRTAVEQRTSSGRTSWSDAQRAIRLAAFRPRGASGRS